MEQSTVDKGVGSSPASYTVIIEEDPATGDLILPIPDEIIQELGLKEGDVLNWEMDGDRVILSKA